MSDDFIGIDLAGERNVGLRFEQFPEKLRQAFYVKLKEIAARLEAAVRADAPHGATGKLEASITSTVYNDPNSIKARVTVDADFAKAGALEWGAHRRTSVKRHDMRLDHVFARRLAAPTIAKVAAYSRTPNIEATKFLRSPLADEQIQINEELRQVLEDAIAEFEDEG